MNWAHLLPLLIFVFIPVFFSFINYFAAKRKTKASIPALIPATIINSAVLFSLSYNFIFFLQELFLVLGKNLIGLKSYLYHNNHTWQGTHPKENLMQGSGAVAILLIGMICLFLQQFINKYSWAKPFFIWLSFNGFMQSLPQFATAKFAPDTDTGQALKYLELTETAEWLITLGSYALIIAGLLYFSQLLLKFSPNNESGTNRFHYLKNIVLLAMGLGILLIIPFRVPPSDRIMSVIFLSLICAPTMMGFGWKYFKPESLGNRINEKPLIIPVILLIGLLLFFQFYLSKGISFSP